MIDRRAVSDVVGFALVFGLVASTVAIVTVTGFNTLTDVRNAEQITNAERASDILADNIEDIYQESAPSRSTEISLAEAQLNTVSTITVNISWDDTSDSRPQANRRYDSVRPIIWESSRTGETKVVYALGAVLRDDPGPGGLMVVDPPFVLRDERIVFPLVRTQVDQGRSYGGSTVRVRATAQGSGVINASTSSKYDEIWLNVTTPRAEIWQSYLDRQSAVQGCGVNTTSNGNQQVACEFETPGSLYITSHSIDIEIAQ